MADAPAATCGRTSTRTSNSGSARRSSRAKNATPAAAPTAAAESTGALVQPASTPSMRANTMPVRAMVESAAPGRSSGGAPGRRDSGSERNPSAGGQQHEGDVDEKHPAPARRVDEHAADNRPQGEPNAPDRRPDTRRLRPQLRREQHRKERQRRRQDAGRRHPHEYPRGDQLAHRLRRGGRGPMRRRSRPGPTGIPADDRTDRPGHCRRATGRRARRGTHRAPTAAHRCRRRGRSTCPAARRSRSSCPSR